MNDKVNNPSHYTSHPSGVECISITEHYDFCVGNAIKYLWRQGLKNEGGYDTIEKQIEDCKKAIWYINRHITGLQKGMDEVLPLTNKEKVDLLNTINRGIAVAGPATMPNPVSYVFTTDREACARARISTVSQPQKSWLDTND